MSSCVRAGGWAVWASQPAPRAGQAAQGRPHEAMAVAAAMAMAVGCGGMWQQRTLCSGALHAGAWCSFFQRLSHTQCRRVALHPCVPRSAPRACLQRLHNHIKVVVVRPVLRAALAHVKVLWRMLHACGPCMSNAAAQARCACCYKARVRLAGAACRAPWGRSSAAMARACPPCGAGHLWQGGLRPAGWVRAARARARGWAEARTWRAAIGANWQAHALVCSRMRCRALWRRLRRPTARRRRIYKEKRQAHLDGLCACPPRHVVEAAVRGDRQVLHCALLRRKRLEGWWCCLFLRHRVLHQVRASRDAQT